MHEVGAVRIAGAEEAYMWRRCGEGRGVCAARRLRRTPWAWELEIFLSHLHGYSDQVHQRIAATIEEAIRSLDGVEEVRSAHHEDMWLIAGAPSGPDLVEAAATAIDQAEGVGPEAVRGLTGEVMRLVRRHLKGMGFSGSGKTRHRIVASGDGEVVMLYSHGGVIVDLALIPAQLLRLWKETDHYLADQWQTGGCGIQTRLAHLSGADLGGGISPLASWDAGTSARVLAEGIEHHGFSWFDKFVSGDPHDVTTEDFLGSYPPEQMQAAWLVGHPDHPAVQASIRGLQEQLGRWTQGVADMDADSQATIDGFQADIRVSNRLLHLLVGDDC